METTEYLPLSRAEMRQCLLALKARFLEIQQVTSGIPSEDWLWDWQKDQEDIRGAITALELMGVRP